MIPIHMSFLSSLSLFFSLRDNTEMLKTLPAMEITVYKYFTQPDDYTWLISFQGASWKPWKHQQTSRNKFSKRASVSRNLFYSKGSTNCQGHPPLIYGLKYQGKFLMLILHNKRSVYTPREKTRYLYQSANMKS